jgi:hypothetical protein
MGNADSDSKEAITTASVVASGSLAALKLLVGWLSGSLGLLAEAAHSLLDLISSMITLLVVRVAAVPPDSNHPYGHERAEQLGSLAGMNRSAHFIPRLRHHFFPSRVSVGEYLVVRRPDRLRVRRLFSSTRFAQGCG